MLINPFYVGLMGASVLVLGYAWPAKKIKNPRKSFKNWLFVLGALFMLIYSYFNYLLGGAIFYIFLQLLANLASLFLMLRINKKASIVFIILASIAFIGASLFYFEDFSTVLFIIGLSLIAVGYILDSGTVKRNVMLCLGSMFIAIFSYIEGNMIFLYLNILCSIFTIFHIYKLSLKKKY